MPNELMEPTQKQQITETLRNADTVIITTSAKPDIDQVAAAIALAKIMTKLGKRADAIVSSAVPHELNFLATELLHNKFNGIRDFVISLNTSHTEADKLKYVPQGKQLNIYITPYDGNFNAEDVGFSYGDYHCDAVIALGVTKPADLDKEIAAQKALLQKTKLVTINVGATTPASGGMDWHEPNASSVSELLMSLTEALQSGLVDDEIATALLTGIMFKTEHFTNAATTPKVMTMAAQLMAAGAKQTDILAHLQPPATVKKPAEHHKTAKPIETGALHAAQETSIPHPKRATQGARPQSHKIPRPAATVPPPVPQPPKPSPPPPPDSGHHTIDAPPPSAIAPLTHQAPQFGAPPPPPPPAAPLSPFPTQPPPPPGPPLPQAPLGQGPAPSSVVNPSVVPPLQTPPPANEAGTSPPPPPHVDVSAARKAVEDALARGVPPPPPPPIPPAS